MSTIVCECVCGGCSVCCPFCKAILSILSSFVIVLMRRELIALVYKKYPPGIVNVNVLLLVLMVPYTRVIQ